MQNRSEILLGHRLVIFEFGKTTRLLRLPLPPLAQVLSILASQKNFNTHPRIFIRIRQKFLNKKANLFYKNFVIKHNKYSKFFTHISFQADTIVQLDASEPNTISSSQSKYLFSIASVDNAIECRSLP